MNLNVHGLIFCRYAQKWAKKHFFNCLNKEVKRIMDDRKAIVRNYKEFTKLGYIKKGNPPTNSLYGNKRDSDYDGYASYLTTKRLDSNGSLPSVKLKRNEKPVGDPAVFAKVLADKHTWIIGNPMISNVRYRSDEISYMINRTVLSTDNVIFVGNMLAPSCANYFSVLMDFISSLKTSNVFLILGNEDRLQLRMYADIGFKYVTDRAIRTVDNQKILISYYPERVTPDYLNFYCKSPVNYFLGTHHFCIDSGDSTSKLKMYKIVDVVREYKESL